MAVEAIHMPGRHVATVVAAIDLPLTAEPAGLDGLVTAMARTLNEAAGDIGAEDFAIRLGRIGASWIAGAGHDGPRIAIEVPVGRLEPAIDLLATALIAPAFPAQALRTYIAAATSLTAQREASGSGQVLAEFLGAVIGPDRRLGRRLEGSPLTLRALRPADLAAAHSRLVRPQAVTLVVVGDLGGVEVTAMAERAFGAWQATEPPPRHPRLPLEPAAPRLVFAAKPGAAQTHIAIGTLVPTRHHPDWEPLNVAAHLLGAGGQSLVNASLREREGVSYGFEARLMPMRGGSVFLLKGAVRKDSTHQALREILMILASRERAGFDRAACEAASRYLSLSAPLQYESARAVAQQRVDILAAQLPEDYVDRRMKRLGELEPGDISGAFARHINSRALTVVIAGDPSHYSEPQIRELVR